MPDRDTCWVTPQPSALPFFVERLDAIPAPVRSLVHCGEESEAWRYRLDWVRLANGDRQWLEGGEYLPALCLAWLDRAAALLRWCAQNRSPAALLDVPSRRLLQLSITDLLYAMGSGAWFAEGQVALVWGFAHDILMQPRSVRWPLRCRGAVFPCGDGLDTGCWAPAADLASIGLRPNGEPTA